MEARMDGTPEQQLRWRVSALREALSEITTMDGIARQIARNALGVDDHNATLAQPEMPREEWEELDNAADWLADALKAVQNHKVGEAAAILLRHEASLQKLVGFMLKTGPSFKAEARPLSSTMGTKE